MQNLRRQPKTNIEIFSKTVVSSKAILSHNLITCLENYNFKLKTLKCPLFYKGFLLKKKKFTIST